MPVSLCATSPVDLPIPEVVSTSLQSNSSSNIVKKKVKNTKEMVEQALIELHNKKGVSLRKIYSFITSTYQLETLTKVRLTLIKNHLYRLRDNDEIVSLTGKGLNGHFKLVDKGKFLKKINNISVNSTKSKATKGQKLRVSKDALIKNRKIIKPTEFERSASREETRNGSMFDTPMLYTQVTASTPFLRHLIVPGAPAVAQRQHRKDNNKTEENIATPRSSLPSKKRRLNRVPE